ncbi:ubiquitin carboxyl-terminal hydrolase family protein, putative [Ichthyophthirius multifiliis]|uniref:ubiquitinyl hydrolase 1 n=1 Tax=Ichthyophthirius multifiliis TaxID=5932 RepID=G0QXF0_ICHMU|nr:ubiquitin carboxyl-terminal hydrolase family protein, putative [Ichthyophthirius multifiliis]EGR30106.1 ubiquitin carboxyl-terminal hydrolase family protein, putative [Ichthyophthirius multifiliis]|eukprot:XP_004031342.1 ubiquitin carboxyl-terminal hydrolase family protein, putative [Ichthyophthirius multifiliis]
MISNEYLNDLNPENKLGTGGYLSVAYSNLMKEMWQGNQSSISPHILKKVIGKLAPQFMGYNQQDSQELLSYILDGLHEDLNRIKEKPLIENIEYDGGSNNDQLISQKFNENYKKRNDSIIADLILGQFKSTLECPTCGKISITFDPYMTLSLPIPQENYRQIQFFIIYKDSRVTPTQLSLKLDSNTTILQLKQILYQYTKINAENLEFCNLKDFYITQIFENNETIKVIEQYGNQNIFYLQQFQIPKILVMNDQFIQKRYFNTITIYIIIQNNQSEPIPILLRKRQKTEQINLQDDDTNTIIQEIIQNSKYNADLFNFKNQDGREIPFENCENKSISQYIDKGKEGKECLNIRMLLQKNSEKQLYKFNRYKDEKDTKILENSNLLDKKITIQKCLQEFTKKEILESGNEWYCNKCKEHKKASKIMQIYSVPKILIIHLKRFKSGKMRNFGKYFFESEGKKIDDFVNFEIQNLDLSDFVISKFNQQNYIYDLFAVSQHYGGTSGGHYTAAGFNFENKKWFQFNDSQVDSIQPQQVVNKNAYLLFYRRREE